MSTRDRAFIRTISPDYQRFDRVMSQFVAQPTRRRRIVNSGRRERGRLGSHLLVGKLGNTGSLGSVFHGDGADIPVGINVKDGVLIQVLGFGHWSGLELDIERVGVGEVLNLPGLNPRSKNAL